MAFSTNIEDQSIEKHSLVVIRPRKRLTGWNIVSGIIYSIPFDYKVTRVWQTYSNDNGYSEGGSPSVTSNQFYYDSVTKTLYAGSTVDPDTLQYPGLTVEFELNISDAPFTGPRDPLNGSSEVIDWIPYLKNIPQSQNGDSSTLYGFIPLVQSNLSILNGDGFFNSLLYDTSFYLNPVKVYILANSNYEKGVLFSDVQQIFIGFSSGMDHSDNTLNISCVDYNIFFEREYSLGVRINTSDFPNAEPDSKIIDREWWVRQVRGMVDDFRPINIDYSASPTTSNNRVWIVRELEDDAEDLAGYLNYTVDHTAPNTPTRTYFTDPPAFNELDSIWLIHNSVNHYTIVSNVNRSLKYIEHLSITRTIVAGDTGARSDVGYCMVQDEDGAVTYLMPNRDFTLSNDTSKNVVKLVLANNWEASANFTKPVFLPESHNIYLRVYSSSWLEQYASSNDVGALADNSGRSSQAVTILNKLISRSGFDINLIDENTFSAATNQSLGFAIPSSHSTTTLPTYKTLISQVLSSMLWKLSFIQDGSLIKLGLIELGPFTTAGDYTADESEHNNLSFKHDYGDVYSNIILNYAVKERLPTGFENVTNSWQHINGISNVTNETARDLHFSSKTFQTTILQFDPLEADIIANRYSIILGDRRGLYSVILGQAFLNKGNLGSSYVLKSERLPGFDFVYGTEQERQLSLVEMQKSSQAVTITLEDQKGIQDNAGDW